MKLCNLLSCILLTFFSIPSISGDLSFGATKASSLFNQANANRILLLGFKDQHINRVQSASISSSYRRRGSYQSSAWSQRTTTQIGSEYNLQKLSEWPMTEVGIHCAVYLVPSGLSLEKTIDRLAKDKRIDIVQKIHQFQTKAHNYNDPYYKLQSNMHAMQIGQAHGIATGRNVTIAMIDTGVDITHPDLNGQIGFNKNFASGVSSSFSTDMHGTAIAGILVARTNNETGIIGIAPDARLIVLKACWPNKTNSFDAICNSFTLALAVNSAIKSGAKILNMSLSGPQDPLLELLLKKATEKGMIVIASDPGSTKNSERFPASLENVIPVQTIRNSNSKNLNQNQSINAPGEHILTTLPHGSYEFVSGSSISAAQVSGIVALLLELKPDLTLSETKKILQKSVLATCNAPKKGLTFAINANTAILDLCNEVACPATTNISDFQSERIEPVLIKSGV